MNKCLSMLLQKSHESVLQDNKLIKNNNYTAKIDILSSAASIFAEMT